MKIKRDRLRKKLGCHARSRTQSLFHLMADERHEIIGCQHPTVLRNISLIFICEPE